MQNGYPTTQNSDILELTFPRDRTQFLPAFNKAIGPFPRAHDYFGDGSLYLIDAIGHLPGHINILARTSAAGSWIYLGADTAHDNRLLTREKEVATMMDPSGRTLCAHANKADADKHIERVGSLLSMPGVHVLLAHDWEWYERNEDKKAFLPGVIPPAAL